MEGPLNGWGLLFGALCAGVTTAVIKVWPLIVTWNLRSKRTVARLQMEAEEARARHKADAHAQVKDDYRTAIARQSERINEAFAALQEARRQHFEEVALLTAENERLRAELARVTGGGAPPVA